MSITDTQTDAQGATTAQNGHTPPDAQHNGHTPQNGHGHQNGTAPHLAGAEPAPQPDIDWTDSQIRFIALALDDPARTQRYKPKLSGDCELIFQQLEDTQDAGKAINSLIQISRSDSRNNIEARQAVELMFRLRGHVAPNDKGREEEVAYNLVQEIGEAPQRVSLTLGYHLTDTGNAERFISQYGDRILYNKALGFHLWNDHYWAPDENDQIYEWGKATVRNIYAEASHADDEQRPKIAAWAKTSESLPRRNAMIELTGKDGPKATVDEFDRNPLLLNVRNGTLDLETGKLYKPDRKDRITKAASVVYDPKATCPLFIQFLSAVLGGDIELAVFLQRFFGYTLTGSTREQCFLILHGAGSNGKSTLLNVLRWLLGAYCKQTKPDTLMQRKFGDGIPNDVAMLRSARMVTAIETNEARKFDEAKIKEITGTDPIVARFMRKEFFEFVPEFKIYLATNHKPTIEGTDDGIWRRVRLVPFNVQFWNGDKGESGPAHLEADKTLAEKLQAELPGILNWALEGCLNWQRDGLPVPKAVTDATKTYRTEQDLLETFLESCCIRREGSQTANLLLFDEYKKWAKAEDQAELTQMAFTARMKMKGFENQRGTGGARVWHGVGLISLEAK